MPDRLTLARETIYTFTQLTEDDVVMLAAGLATPSVRAMAHLALSGPEELARNAEKPSRAGRGATSRRPSGSTATGPTATPPGSEGQP